MNSNNESKEEQANNQTQCCKVRFCLLCLCGVCELCAVVLVRGVCFKNDNGEITYQEEFTPLLVSVCCCCVCVWGGGEGG